MPKEKVSLACDWKRFYLTKKAIEIHKDTGEASDEEKVVEEPEQPAVDETGRILFRKRAKDTSKRNLQAIIDEERGVEPVKKKKKKQKVTSLLSFEDNDE